MNFSKKILRKNKKELKKTELKRNKNIKISFFLDPIVCHRIHRDFLIPDYKFTEGSQINHFQEYLHYKTISQVHIRENGLILQFNDHMPGFITPLGLLQERLNSLGKKFAHELADFLTIYYEFFEKEEENSKKLKKEKDNLKNLSENLKKEEENLKNLKEKQVNTNNLNENIIKKSYIDPILQMNSGIGLVVKLIDELFVKYCEDVLLIAVYKVYNGMDDRLVMLCYNEELIKWLSFEEDFKDKVFENEFIEQFLQMFTYNSFELCMKELTEFVKNFPRRKEFNPENDIYYRDVNTVFGVMKGAFRLKNFEFKYGEEKYNIICSILLKEEANKWVKGLKKTKKCEEKIEKKSDWGKLLKLYYPKIL